MQYLHEDYYEIIIVTRGKITRRIGGEYIPQKRGDVTIVCPDVAHEIDGDSTSEHFNIAVSEDRFQRLMVGKDAVKNALQKSDYITVSLNAPELNYILDCVGRIDDECSTPMSVSLAEAVISVIFLSIMSAQLPETVSEYNVRYYCRDAIIKIEKGSVTFKSTGDIYCLYPVSHTSFIAAFKAITGKTPSEYLRKAKLIRASELLLNTSRSVLDIACEVGYDSMSHFIKCFKSCFGITPLKYRKAGVSPDIKEDEYE